MATIQLRNISKTYKDEITVTGNKVISNLDLTIPDSKIVVILGPTGCGKTTILNIISGLSAPDSGQVLYDGVNKNNVPAGERNIGMVFQNFALYPNHTVETNIMSYYFFRKKSVELAEDAKEKYERTSKLMGVDMKHLLSRKPPNLSGGEKQKVAIARCITRDPDIFLLDEPFSNLDQQTRYDYRTKLKQLLKHFNITTVYVTHDQMETAFFADLIVVMNKNGDIVQTGSLTELYDYPKNKFIASFLNLHSETPAINFLDGDLVADNLIDTYIGIRPDDFYVSDKFIAKSIEGRVINVYHAITKPNTILQIELNAMYNNPDINSEIFFVQIPINMKIKENQFLWLTFRKYYVFDKYTDSRIGIEVQD